MKTRRPKYGPADVYGPVEAAANRYAKKLDLSLPLTTEWLAVRLAAFGYRLVRNDRRRNGT